MRWPAAGLACVALLATCAPAGGAAPGELDHSFGHDGIAFLPIAGGDCGRTGWEVTTLLTSSRGIVVGADLGYQFEYENDHGLVVRLDRRGEGDRSFGGDGRACVPYALARGRSVALADGSLLTADSSAGGNHPITSSLTVSRVAADGGGARTVRVPFPPTFVQRPAALVASQAGPLLVADWTTGDNPSVGPHRRMAGIRAFDRSGAYDATRSFSFLARSAGPSAWTSRGLVVSLATSVSFITRFARRRQDPLWGKGGVTPTAGTGAPSELAALGDGRIAMATHVGVTAGLTMLDDRGRPDSSWGGHGRVSLKRGVDVVQLAADGQSGLLVHLTEERGSDDYDEIIRLTGAGHLDRSFAKNGILAFDLPRSVGAMAVDGSRLYVATNRPRPAIAAYRLR